MELTNPIRMKTSYWVALDLLALSLLIGVPWGIFAIATGAWWPFGATDFPDGPLYAYSAWTIVVITGGLLIGWQLQYTSGGEEAHTAQQPALRHPALHASVGFTRDAVELPPPDLRQWTSVTEDALQDEESEEGEPALATAGR